MGVASEAQIDIFPRLKVGEDVNSGDLQRKPYEIAVMSDSELRCPPQKEREAIIRYAVANAGEVTHFVPAETGYIEVPVVEVDHRVLLYRADNGRVLSELVDAALARGTSVDELKASAESAEVQRLLHDLLIEKARDPEGPIHAELERFGHQTEPLLIREDGVLVNGNRRLAAMRDLQARDPERYARFDRVQAAVLPSRLATYEIEFIEAALQMAPDLKLDYGWINRRLKLRQHVTDMGAERVLSAYRFSNPAEIECELAELALAETYLEWIRQPRQFALVADQEEAFTAFNAQLKAMTQNLPIQVWKRIGFAMIKSRPDLDSKIMHYFPFTDPVPPLMRNWVPRSLAEDRGIVERQSEGENRRLDNAAADRLLPLLDDPGQAKTTALANMALIDMLKGNQGRLVGFAQLIHNLHNANKILQGKINIDNLTGDQVRRLRAELAALQQYTGQVPPEGHARHDILAKEPILRRIVRKGWKTIRRRIR